MITRYGRTGFALFGAALLGGPFLAGLARHGWAVLPVFAALFLLHVSAARRPDLATAAGWAALAMLAAVQVGLVGLTWGLGIALGGIAGPPLVLPVWGPILLSVFAAGFGAWAWRDAAEMDVMLDSAIAALERSGSAGLDWPEPDPGVRAALDDALEELRSLAGWTAAVIDPIVARLEQRTGAAAFDAFYDVAGQEGPDNEPVVDFALLRYLARPEVMARLIDRGEAGLAPQLLIDAPEVTVRAEARARLADLLDAGAPADQLPDAERLAILADRFSGEGYEGLAALRGRVA